MLISVLKKAVLPFLLFGILAAFSGIGPPSSGRAEASPPQAAQEAPLRFGVLYLLSPKELYERWTPFGEYLSRKTGRKVDLVIPRNFDHLVELARSGQLDLLFINPYVYILLKKEIGIEAVAAQVAYGSTFAPSYIVVRKDSGIRSLEDLRGRRSPS
jgi:phosphonate transport system substrate-binding protein